MSDSNNPENKNLSTKDTLIGLAVGIGVIYLLASFFSGSDSSPPAQPSTTHNTPPSQITSLQCEKYGIVPFIFVDSAGLDSFSQKGRALTNLISSGNFSTNRIFEKNGFCYAEIHVSGTYQGNSHQATLTGQMASQ